jgi:hypothetical protein
MMIHYIVILIIITLLIYCFLTSTKQNKIEGLTNSTHSYSIVGDKTFGVAEQYKGPPCGHKLTKYFLMGCFWNRINSIDYKGGFTNYEKQWTFNMVYSNSSKTNPGKDNRATIFGLRHDEPYKFISAKDWIPTEYLTNQDSIFRKRYAYISVGKDVILFFNNSKTDVPTERSIAVRDKANLWHYTREYSNATNDKYNDYKWSYTPRGGNHGGLLNHMRFNSGEMGFTYSNPGSHHGFWGHPNQIFSFMLVKTRTVLDALDAGLTQNLENPVIATLLQMMTVHRNVKCVKWEPEFLDDRGLTPYPNTIPYIDFRIAHHLVALKGGTPDARNLLIELGEMKNGSIGLRNIDPNGSGSKNSGDELNSTSTFSSVGLGGRNGYRNKYGVEVGKRVNTINGFVLNQINIPAGVRVWAYQQNNCMGTPFVFANWAHIHTSTDGTMTIRDARNNNSSTTPELMEWYGSGRKFNIQGIKSFVSQPIWATQENVDEIYKNSDAAGAARIIQNANEEIARLAAAAEVERLRLLAEAAAAASERERIRLIQEAEAEAARVAAEIAEVARLAEVAAENARVADEIRMANLVEEAKEESLYGWKYKGCYVDDGSRDLPLRAVNGEKFTQKQCRQHAVTMGKKYFGLQFGGECWLGDDYNFGAIDKTESQPELCNIPCARNSAYSHGHGIGQNDDLLMSTGETGCGGGWANSIYQVNTIAPGKECGEQCEKAKRDLYERNKTLSLTRSIQKKDWECYIERYPDLKHNFDNNIWPSNEQEANDHWDRYGRGENRTWGC